ncbi:MAG: type II toxin-antitoxin system RelE/ParE family toxin [Bryobacteraceae bacterium]
MDIKVVATRAYEKRIEKLLSPAEREAMESAIVSNPGAHPIIPKTNGVRKARWSRAGTGKRGGIRAIYYWFVQPGLVYMIAAYAKNEKENLSDADKAEIRKIVESLRG